MIWPIRLATIVANLVLCIAFLLPSNAPHAAVLIAHIRGPNVQDVDPNTWSLGFEFKVEFPTTITALGAFDHNGDGFAQPQQVGLWSAEGTLLVSTFVDNSDPVVGDPPAVSWRFRDITPLNLAVGETYIVASQGGEPYASYNEGIAVHRQVTYMADRFGLVGSMDNDPLVFPNSSASIAADQGGGWFGGNARFIPTPSPVSDPTPLLLDFTDPVGVSTDSSPPAPNIYSLGYEFQVNSPTTIRALGGFDHNGDGFAQPQQVGLWSAEGTLLVSTFVDNSDSLEGFWRFRDITPISLLVGRSYRLASQGGEPYCAITQGFTVSPKVTFIAEKWGHALTSANFPLIFPDLTGTDFNQDGNIDHPFFTVEEGGGIFGANAKLGPLIHISLPSDISNQTAGVAFPITIEAVGSDGQRNTSFNNDVTLSTNNSSLAVSPSNVTLVNGYASADVVIDGSSAGTVLRASHATLSGNSNTFDVIDSAAIPTSIDVNLKDAAGNIFTSSALVYLEDSNRTLVPSVQSTQNGNYRFDNVPAGSYSVTAISDEEKMHGYAYGLSVITSEQQIPINHTIEMISWLKPPVLIIPGILGSTIEGIDEFSNFNYYPQLEKPPRVDASKLKIMNAGPFGGFEALKNQLESEFSVHLVPWDWRASLNCPPLMSCINAWAEYLMPSIDSARNPNRDNIIDFPTVDIVAHSMGGLLVRAYIQSDNYRNDIHKFAMVGTPNMGAAITYYMVQGGNPIETDRVNKGDCTDSHIFLINVLGNETCFYSMATAHLYKEINGVYPFGKSTHPGQYSKSIDAAIVPYPSKLVEFYEEHVPTGRQLLPTYDALETAGSGARKLSIIRNTFLEELNTATLTDYYAAVDIPASADKVRTGIFASYNIPTLVTINVSDIMPLNDIYKDGEPDGVSDLVKEGGDGTVPLCSAALMEPPCNALDRTKSHNISVDPAAPWATLYSGRKGKHATLAGEFKCEIHSFLNEGCDP